MCIYPRDQTYPLWLGAYYRDRVRGHIAELLRAYEGMEYDVGFTLAAMRGVGRKDPEEEDAEELDRRANFENETFEQTIETLMPAHMEKWTSELEWLTGGWKQEARCAGGSPPGSSSGSSEDQMNL